MQVHPSAIDAIQCLKSRSRVFIHGAAATPTRLLNALIERLNSESDLDSLELVHLHTNTDPKYADDSLRGKIRISAFFLGENLRKKFEPGFVDYIPVFLSEIPSLFRSGRLPLDYAFVQVSPPDEHGFCSLGSSVDVARAAVDTAKTVIAQVNPKMPRVHGDGFIHVSDIDHAIEVNDDLPELKRPALTDAALKIANHTASLIEDGSTLQMGIGAIPDAVLSALKNHKNLGIHSEMWSDGAMELIRSGAVTNSLKKIHPGKSVSTFFMGTRALYDFINDNPTVAGLDAAYVNNPHAIAKNPKVVAINSAVEIDLTGQVCADSIGSRVISGTGGQMDFIRGASLSPGGKPIIALPSRTHKNEPRIVSTLKTGAGVVTTRAHVHYVITEYGIADLYGKNLAERARLLIGISHPDDREKLSREFHELFR